MRKTKAQLQQTAMKLMPSNKALGIAPTRKQRRTATSIVAAALVPTVTAADAPMPLFGKLPKRDLRGYQLLEGTFEKSGRQYRKVWSNDWVSMYAVKCCDSIVYEVFMRVLAEASSGEINEVAFSTPAREVFPSDRVFGKTAWCTLSQSHAAEKFRHAVETAVQRHL